MLNRKHQKERAIALMAGNGFLLAQSFTNQEMAKSAIETMSYVWAAIDGGSASAIVRGTLMSVTFLILPAVGLWSAFSALRIADTDSQGLSKSCEARIRWALIPIIYVVAMGAIVFFARFGWPAVESISLRS